MKQESEVKTSTPPRPKAEKRRRRRRSSRHMLASVFGIFLLFIAIAAGALFWRLGQGPIRLTRYLPIISEQFETHVPGYQIDVGGADLVWASGVQRPQLQLREVRLTRVENGRISRFGRLHADISLASLMVGDVKLNKVTLEDLEITVERRVDGDLMFSLPGIEQSGGRLDFRELLKSTEDGPLSLVSELDIQNLQFSLRDANTGAFWEAPATDVILKSTQDGVDIAFETEKLKNGWPLRGAALLDPSGELDMVLSGNRIKAESLPPFVIEFVPPPLQQGELDGSVSLTLNSWGQVVAGRGDFAISLLKPLELKLAEGRIQLGEFAVEGSYVPETNGLRIEAISMRGDGLEFDGKGEIKRAGRGQMAQASFVIDGKAIVSTETGLYAQAVSFEQTAVRGTYVFSSDRLIIDSATLSSGPVTVVSVGDLVVGADDATTLIRGQISGLDVNGLKRLWPSGVAPGASSWITSNMLDGQIDSAHFVYSRVPDDDDGVESLKLNFEFRDVATHHIGRATPITGASGRASLTLERFDLAMESGQLGKLALAEGVFSIPSLRSDVIDANVALQFSGEARDLLAFIDEPPISALSSIDIDPAKVVGKVSGDVTGHFPLLSDLKLGEVDFDVDVKARGLSAKNVAEGYSVSKGEIAFNANGDQLRAQGTASLNGVPLEVDWTEQFDLSKDQTTDLTISTTLDNAQRETFGIDLDPYVNGPVAVQLIKAGKGMKISRVGVIADLSDAVVRLPKTGLVGDKNTPKKLSFTATIDGDDIRFTDLAYTSPDLQIADAEIELKSGFPRSASLPHLVIKDVADIGVQYSTAGPDGALLYIKGQFLDLTRFVSSSENENAGRFELVQLDSLPQLTVRAALNQFKISKAVAIEDFQITLASRPGDLDILKGEARFAGSKPLKATWMRSSGGTRRFIVNTVDAGSVLRALGYYDRAEDGELELIGTFKAAGQDGQEFDIKGRALVKNMVIRGVSSLSDILDESKGATLASLSEEIKNEGVKIDVVEVPFSIGDTEITIGDAFARGDSVGFTFAGTINREQGQANMGGTIVPAYGLNSALGNIPLLGRLLVGRAKEGVVGITYSVSGPIDDPNVSVNTLSALAPGILRRIFDQHGGTSQQTSAANNLGPDYPGDDDNNADP